MKVKVVLRFYANTVRDNNKLFAFRIPSWNSAEKRLSYFKTKGFVIRSAYVGEYIEGRLVRSTRIF